MLERSIKRYNIVIAVIFILAIILLALLLLFAHREALRLVKKQFNEQQLSMARQAALGIERNIDILARELELLSVMPALRQMRLEEAEKAMERTFNYASAYYINDIALLDADGIVRLPLKSPQLKGADFSYRKYFKAAREMRKAAPAYEFITFKGVDEGEKGIIIAMPVFTEAEDFGGVVLLTLKIRDLIEGQPHTPVRHCEVYHLEAIS